MKPKNVNNFIVEITPEIMEKLHSIYKSNNYEPYLELHYSPYWLLNAKYKFSGLSSTDTLRLLAENDGDIAKCRTILNSMIENLKEL